MKSVLPRLVQGFLLLAALCLLAAVLIPWRNPAPPPSQPQSPVVRPADPRPSRASPEPASPESVLTLFVKRSIPAPIGPFPTPAATKPVAAPWLTFLGFYSSAPGEPYYLLKDTRSGRVITIGSRSVSANGWAVVAVEATRIIVRKDSDTYIVPKR